MRLTEWAAEFAWWNCGVEAARQEYDAQPSLCGSHRQHRIEYSLGTVRHIHDGAFSDARTARPSAKRAA